MSYKDKADNGRIVTVCLWGEYNALYDYTRNEYIPKDRAEKLWKYIEEHFDELELKFKEVNNG